MIGEGAEALNAYIDSGEIEELADLISQNRSDTSDNEDNDDNESDSPEAKRMKTDRIKNHNAQIIFKNTETNSAIPSLMTINVPLDVPPPSLLNLNVAPPFDDSGNWQSARNDFNNRNSKVDGAKRRNRDSEGNRISRFDRERPSRFDNNDNSRNNNQRRNNRRI